MNSCVRHLALLALGVFIAAGAQAQNLPGSNDANNSPIHRANPNSMQGTQPSAPPIRGPNTVPTPRQPTVENRGIGNGQPIRSVPNKSPTFIPNPPSRSGDSNR
mgnify:CR=1 FL=1